MARKGTKQTSSNKAQSRNVNINKIAIQLMNINEPYPCAKDAKVYNISDKWKPFTDYNDKVGRIVRINRDKTITDYTNPSIKINKERIEALCCSVTRDLVKNAPFGTISGLREYMIYTWNESINEAHDRIKCTVNHIRDTIPNYASNPEYAHASEQHAMLWLLTRESLDKIFPIGYWHLHDIIFSERIPFSLRLKQPKLFQIKDLKPLVTDLCV